jgi:hypothetical protein
VLRAACSVVPLGAPTGKRLVRSMLAMPILEQLTAAAIGLEAEDEAVGARGVPEQATGIS